MHHKTIRNFITEGKLRAVKVGKQWRISHDDLRSFMDKNKEYTDKEQIVEFSTNETQISTASRSKNSTVKVKYYESYNKVMILLWGDVTFIEEMLSTISMLVER